MITSLARTRATTMTACTPSSPISGMATVAMMDTGLVQVVTLTLVLSALTPFATFKSKLRHFPLPAQLCSPERVQPQVLQLPHLS